jgi:hypothetical protein
MLFWQKCDILLKLSLKGLQVFQKEEATFEIYTKELKVGICVTYGWHKNATALLFSRIHFKSEYRTLSAALPTCW